MEMIDDSDAPDEMVSKAHVPDLAVAVAEDAIAIAGGLLILSHFGP